MGKLTFLSQKELTKLPKDSGVYFFKKGKKFLYIGKTNNIKERVKNHFQQTNFRNNLFLNQVEKIGYIKTDSELEALILETILIKKYKPKYNIVWKDDKNYFFVGITKEDFPKIFITHQIKSKNQESKIKNEFIGPFVSGKSLKEALKVLRKVFPYRSCKALPNKPCLWYHLERCPAPCQTKLKTQIPKSKNFQLIIKKQCQKNVKNLKKILEGKKVNVLKNLRKEMRELSKKQNFEQAAKIRNKIKSLEKIFSHSKILKNFSFLNSEKNWQEKEKKLKKILKIKNNIKRIEAYDVSNIQGKKAAGSLITFIDGKADKNFYRKFKIKIEGKPNDTAMIKEILTRRFKHLEWGMPDLILIDGGKPQLSAGLKVKNQISGFKKIKIIALAKRKNELFIEGQKKPFFLKKLPREIFNLILQLRDEAHRFALSYHKKLRDIDLKSNI